MGWDGMGWDVTHQQIGGVQKQGEKEGVSSDHLLDPGLLPPTVFSFLFPGARKCLKGQQGVEEGENAGGDGGRGCREPRERGVSAIGVIGIIMVTHYGYAYHNS